MNAAEQKIHAAEIRSGADDIVYNPHRHGVQHMHPSLPNRSVLPARTHIGQTAKVVPPPLYFHPLCRLCSLPAPSLLSLAL